MNIVSMIFIHFSNISRNYDLTDMYLDNIAKCVVSSEPFSIANINPGASFCKTAFVA